MDMAKAFDTLSNSFLGEVLKFFNFGENFRRWLSLIGNNRTACVLLDNGNCSRNFCLERGRPQGDNISPITFNLCIQILIFKLELDNDILSIPRAPNGAPGLINSPDVFRYESNRETGRNEGLADDNTTITILDIRCLSRIKTCLSDFSAISGLCCNFEKSVLVPINQPTQAELHSLQELGFTVSDSFKLLGLTINSSLNNNGEIYEEILNKIRSLILFWERFRLSLPGRLTIMKTYLISQLNYIGSFLPAPDGILQAIQNCINNYVKKNIRISEDRIYLPAKLGGLGIFKVKTFLQAQHCSWIMRAFKFTIDNWRYDLAASSPTGNILQLRSRDINEFTNPILQGLVESYEDFYSCFSAMNGNYKEAFIFDNAAFTRGPTDNGKLDPDFFGYDFYARYQNIIRELTFNSCFAGRRVKTIGEFHESGLPVSPVLWFRLQAALLYAKARLRKQDDSDNITENIAQFLSKVKRGSKPFRKILTKGNKLNYNPMTHRSVVYFSELSNTGLPDIDVLKACLGLWKHSYLTNDFRNFLFQLRNNCLPLNNRLNAFDPGISPTCNFCRIIDRDAAARDGFYHFFFSCPISNRLLRRWAELLEPAPDIDSPEFANFYWFGASGDENHPTSLALLPDLFKYCLWKFKLKRKIPNPACLRNEFEFLLGIFTSASRKLRNSLENINMFNHFLQARG